MSSDDAVSRHPGNPVDLGSCRRRAFERSPIRLTSSQPYDRLHQHPQRRQRQQRPRKEREKHPAAARHGADGDDTAGLSFTFSGGYVVVGTHSSLAGFSSKEGQTIHCVDGWDSRCRRRRDIRHAWEGHVEYTQLDAFALVHSARPPWTFDCRTTSSNNRRPAWSQETHRRSSTGSPVESGQLHVVTRRKGERASIGGRR